MYKTRIFLSIFIVTIIPLVILAIFSYKTYIDEVSAKTDTSTKATLTQLDSRVENVMDSIRSYYAEIETKDEFLWLNNAQRNQGYNDYVNLKKASDLLKGSLYLRDYIENYIYVDYKQGYVFSNNGIVKLSKVKNLDEVESLFLNESQFKIQWKNNLDYPEPYITGKDGEIPVDGYLLVLGFPLINTQTDSYLIVRLNRTRLYNLISQGLGDLDVVVTDWNGKVVYGSEDAFSEYCVTNWNIFQNNEPIFTAKMSSGDKFRITSSVSQVSGLHYMVGYNRTAVNEGAQRILSFSVILFIILGVVLLLMVIGTKLIYHPINLLKEQMSPYVDEEENGDEFNYIKKGIKVLSDSKDSLERAVSQQRSVLLELFMSRMVRGELSMDKINQHLEEFHINPKSYFQIMAIQIGFEKGNTIQDITRADAFRLTILKAMPKEILNRLFLTPISYANSIVFIVGANREEDLGVVQINQDMKAFITRQHPCYIMSGVSQIFHKLTHLRTALNESMEALKSVKMREKDVGEDIVYYSGLVNDQNQRSVYDLLHEQEISQAIDNGDAESACQIMNQFVDSLIVKNISLSDQSYYLNRFLVAILKVATDAELSMVQIFETEQINIFTYFSQILYDDRKIRDFYTNRIIVPITDKLMISRRSHSTDILDSVLELVKMTNGDITLTECAERLNYHPSYIWKVLKSEKNMTFTDFIAMEKLEIAKDMLMNTDLTITEIAVKLRYTNTQNFIRFFSKHEHVSPGKYKAYLKNIVDK